MSKVCLTLSNNTEYSFDFYGTTLNQRAIPEVVCYISWILDNEEVQWTTSFNEDNVKLQGYMTAGHIVPNETDNDVKAIAALFQKVVDGINKSKGQLT